MLYETSFQIITIANSKFVSQYEEICVTNDQFIVFVIKIQRILYFGRETFR